MYLGVNGGGSVSVERSVSFNGCSASSSCSGGCVAVWMESSEGVVTFEGGCVCTSIQDINGGFVYIECPDGYTLVGQSEWSAFISNYARLQTEKLNWVTETKSSNPISDSLLSFLNPVDFIYISPSPTGTDTSSCGGHDQPCLTMSGGVERLESVRCITHTNTVTLFLHTIQCRE